MSGELAPDSLIECFGCGKNISDFGIHERTRHVERCLGLADSSPPPLLATSFPTPLSRNSEVNDVPDGADFKPAAKRTPAAAGQRSNLHHFWNSPTPPRPSAASGNTNDPSPGRDGQTPPDQSPEKTIALVARPYGKVASLIRSGSLPPASKQSTQSKPTCPGRSRNSKEKDPDLDLALALSASLTRPLPSTKSASSNALTRSRSTGLMNRTRGKGKVATVSQTRLSRPGLEGESQLDVAAHGGDGSPAADAKGKPPPQITVWPVTAAQQIGQQNLWILINSHKKQAEGTAPPHQDPLGTTALTSRVRDHLDCLRGKRAEAHGCPCERPSLWELASRCDSHSMFRSHPRPPIQCPNNNLRCRLAHPYLCSFLL
ncbi:hypothetical protein H4R33_002118 [Dimargaris cristalligena]|nr:hypothetical protein H4R33_002118 [Dimargaris cristalligena]